MANYDDFDLDIRKIKGNMEAEPKGTAAICFPRVRSISWPLPVSRLCPPKRTRLRHP